MLDIRKGNPILTYTEACPGACSTCSRVEFGLGCGPPVVAETSRTSAHDYTAWRTSHLLINKVLGRLRQYIIVALNLEDTRPWFSLFIAIDCLQPSPLPPMDVSDHQMHVFARGGSARERVPLHCCSHFLEMKGSAQDALKAAYHRAARISSYPRHPVLVPPCHIRASPDRSRSRARHHESSECYFGLHLLAFTAWLASIPWPWVLG